TCRHPPSFVQARLSEPASPVAEVSAAFYCTGMRAIARLAWLDEPWGETMANRYTVVVIGSGFGGTMTALSVARAMKKRAAAGKNPGKKETVHILERGTWWTTPVGTVKDLEVRTADALRKKDGDAAVQFWPASDNVVGLVDLFGRCRKHEDNPDGLYDLTEF